MAAYFVILMFVSYLTVHGHAEQHDVGGSSGWSEKTDLAAWVSTQIFKVGDTMVFLYNSHHRVDIVTQDDYNSCNAANPLESYSNGITTVTLEKVGPMYFIDPNPGYCEAGMKLAIDIQDKGKTPRRTPPIPGDGDTSPPVPPSVPAGSYPTKPIGYLIPKPEGAGSSKPCNDLSFAILIGVVLLMN